MALWFTLFASLFGVVLTSPFEGARFSNNLTIVPLHRAPPPPEHRRLTSRHLAGKTDTITPPDSTINLELVDQVPLDVGYGTHFAYLLVGTPPQRLTVIVDTGSHYTAFPCTNCVNCGEGKHTDPYYNPAHSSTVKRCERSVSTVQGDPDHLFHASTCDISQSYTEGSSWKAKKTKDVVKVGPKAFDDETETVDGHPISDFNMQFTFGCQTSETGLFRTQLANGIMGMSNSQDTLVVQMKNSGMIPKRIFSMCFALGTINKTPAGSGGTMVLGGFDARIHDTPVQWVPMARTQSNWFAVEVVDIKVGGTSLGSASSIYQEGKGMIVDSGTTDTYLPLKVATSFKAKWQAAAGRAYGNNRMSLTATEVAALPDIEFVLTNGVTIKVPATQYLEKDGSGWTPRVYLNERSGGVLGANVMQNFDVIFDAEDQMIGWAPSDCTYRHLEEVAAEDDGGGVASGDVPVSLPPAPLTDPPTPPPTDQVVSPTERPTKPPTTAPASGGTTDGTSLSNPPAVVPVPTLAPTITAPVKGDHRPAANLPTLGPAKSPTASPATEEEGDNLAYLVIGVLGGVMVLSLCVWCCLKMCGGRTPTNDYDLAPVRDVEMSGLHSNDDDVTEDRPPAYRDDPRLDTGVGEPPRYSDTDDMEGSSSADTNMEYLDDDDDDNFSRV